MDAPYIERLAMAICHAEFVGHRDDTPAEYWIGVADENKEAYREAAKAASVTLNEKWPRRPDFEGKVS